MVFPSYFLHSNLLPFLFSSVYIYVLPSLLSPIWCSLYNFSILNFNFSFIYTYMLGYIIQKVNCLHILLLCVFLIYIFIIMMVVFQYCPSSFLLPFCTSVGNLSVNYLFILKLLRISMKLI